MLPGRTKTLSSTIAADEPPRFAHPSELELSRLLDASGIPWARKRSKVRRARELHDLVITLHERDDFERLRRRYTEWKEKRR